MSETKQEQKQEQDEELFLEPTEDELAPDEETLAAEDHPLNGELDPDGGEEALEVIGADPGWYRAIATWREGRRKKPDGSLYKRAFVSKKVGATRYNPIDWDKHHEGVVPVSAPGPESTLREAAVAAREAYIKAHSEELGGAESAEALDALIKKKREHGEEEEALRLEQKKGVIEQHSVADVLNVEVSLRYQATKENTFCNVYARDYLDALGTSLIMTNANGINRKLWEIKRPSASSPERPNWAMTHDINEAQEAANRGELVVVSASTGTSRSGHVAVVLGELGAPSNYSAAREEGEIQRPLQSQAGRHNYQRFAFRRDEKKLPWWRLWKYYDEPMKRRSGAFFLYSGKRPLGIFGPETA